MAPIIVLSVSLLLFRALGALGVRAFTSWRLCTRFALAAMFLFTAAAHFNAMHEDLVRMMPPGIPYPRQIVWFTGICEILGAVGLTIPALYRRAGLALAVFLVMVFPANVHAALAGTTIGGQPATALWLRLPLQLLFIGLTLWATQTPNEETAGEASATPSGEAEPAICR